MNARELKTVHYIICQRIYVGMLKTDPRYKKYENCPSHSQYF